MEDKGVLNHMSECELKQVLPFFNGFIILSEKKRFKAKWRRKI
jgi:hypothetical protein